MTDYPKVMVVADLHLDKWLAAGRDPFRDIDPDMLASLDALIVAGDLADKPKIRWPNMLAHLARYVAPSSTYIVPGNHDYYDHVLDGDDRLAAICATAGAHFVQQQVLAIGPARFLCCTLWTDFALGGAPVSGMYDAADKMNDYNSIRIGRDRHRRATPTDVLRVHRDHLAWLEAQLAKPFAGQTIVVTHHAPLGECLAENAEVPTAYASDLSKLIAAHKPDQWLFGHTHYPVSFRQGDTLVRNISLGYPSGVFPSFETGLLTNCLVDFAGSGARDEA